MKKFLLVMFSLILAGCFSLYILDIRFGNDSVLTKENHLEENDNGSSESIVNKVLINDEVMNKPTPGRVPVSEGDVSSGSDIKNVPGNNARKVNNASESTWELVWVDDFEKPTLDLEYWSKVESGENFNKELQCYLLENVYVDGGCLYLETKKENKNGRAYTSGMVQTNSKFCFCYGKIEIRMKMPKGQGMFPAVWLLQQRDTNKIYYEVDIAEYIGCEPNTIYGVNHYTLGSGLDKGYGTAQIKDPSEFHTYSLEWSEKALNWYLDGRLYYTTTRGIPKEEMYIVFNLAVGGEWPGPPDHTTVFPQCMVVDYVKLYRYTQAGEKK